MRYTTILFSAALLALGAGGVAAQTCTQSGTALPVSCSVTTTFSARVPAIVKLTLAGAPYTFADAVEADLDAGYVASSTTPTLTAKANIEYDVTASLPTFTFANAVHAGDDGSGKAVSSFTIDAGAGYTGLSVAGITLFSGTHGTQGPIDVPARINMDWNDFPGTYGGTITFTIVAK